jgi:hypothetical protein
MVQHCHYFFSRKKKTCPYLSLSCHVSYQEPLHPYLLLTSRTPLFTLHETILPILSFLDEYSLSLSLSLFLHLQASNFTEIAMTHHFLHPPSSPPTSSSLTPSPSHLPFQSPPDPTLRSCRPLKKRKKRKEEEKGVRKKKKEEEEKGGW